MAQDFVRLGTGRFWSRHTPRTLPFLSLHRAEISSSDFLRWAHLELKVSGTELGHIPSNSIDYVVTSPPYLGLREYESDGIGMEANYKEYGDSIFGITAELHRVLKPTGILWLNLGDTYKGNDIVGIPWRVALRIRDDQGWILRSKIIWNKIKGPSDSRDRFRNVHEQLFHFAKSKLYYFDTGAITSAPRKAKVENGRVVSATGVTEQSYKREIELSTILVEGQKSDAHKALEEVLGDVSDRKLHDFRMVIKDTSRSTNGNTASVSVRAKQIEQEGFYFLRYNPDGILPGDVWDITPVDTHGRNLHFAPFPEDLVRGCQDAV